MDLAHVQQRLQAIAAAAGDYEHAHGLEDELFVDVLTSIAANSIDPNAKALAAEALRSRKLIFERWCA